MTQSNDLAFSRESLFAAAERLKAKRNTKASAAELESFLEQYRADAFIEDFLSLTVDDAATLALDLWDFNRETEMHQPLHPDAAGNRRRRTDAEARRGGDRGTRHRLPGR